MNTTVISLNTMVMQIWVPTHDDKELLIQAKLAELRQKQLDKEIEKEARRRQLQLNREMKQEARRLKQQDKEKEEEARRLQKQQDKEKEEEARRQKREDEQRRLEKYKRQATEEAYNPQRKKAKKFVDDWVAPDDDCFHDWMHDGQSYYRNNNNHVFSQKNGDPHKWLGIYHPETDEFQKCECPEEYYDDS
jgi:hypothetical protein